MPSCITQNWARQAQQHLQAIYSETVTAAPLQGALSVVTWGRHEEKIIIFLKNGTKLWLYFLGVNFIIIYILLNQRNKLKLFMVDESH